MSKPYEKIRRLLARIFLSPEIKSGDCIINLSEITTEVLSCWVEVETSRPVIKSSVNMREVPGFIVGMKRLSEVVYKQPTQAKLLMPEKIISEPILLKATVNLEINAGSWEAEPCFGLIPVMDGPVLRRKPLEKPELSLVGIPRTLFKPKTQINVFNCEIWKIFHIGLGLVCRIPMRRKPVKLGELGRDALLKYWDTLLKKVPTGSGKDLELLAVFTDVEMDKFSAFDFDAVGRWLMLRPKPPSQRQHHDGRRCDIIYGRFKPEGTILTAVIGSDTNR